MVRKDNKRLEWVGNQLLSNFSGITQTSKTEYETYNDDIVLNNKYKAEVKTLTQDYYFHESIYSGCTQPNNMCVLNRLTKYNTYQNSKWYKLMEGELSYFIAIKRDGIYLFDRQHLKDAYVGDCYIKQQHTKECDDKSVSWEYKAVIDLYKYKYKINLRPPYELFEQDRYN